MSQLVDTYGSAARFLRRPICGENLALKTSTWFRRRRKLHRRQFHTGKTLHTGKKISFFSLLRKHAHTHTYTQDVEALSPSRFFGWGLLSRALSLSNKSQSLCPSVSVSVSLSLSFAGFLGSGLTGVVVVVGSSSWSSQRRRRRSPIVGDKLPAQRKMSTGLKDEKLFPSSSSFFPFSFFLLRVAATRS